MSGRNPIAELCKMALELADLADQYERSPYDMGYGCAVFSQNMRDGVQAIAGLQMQNSSRGYNLKCRKSAMESHDEFFKRVFGDTVDEEFFTEEEQDRLHDAVKDIVAELIEKTRAEVDN